MADGLPLYPSKRPRQENGCRQESGHVPPSSRVLDSVELLERVLVHLPMVDILLFQRVSHKWHAVIRSSLSLQRALFMAAPPGGPVERLELSWDKTPLTINPLVARRFGYAGRLHGDIVRHQKVLYAGASWRGMFLTQPPFKRAIIQVRDQPACVVDNKTGVTMGMIDETVKPMGGWQVGRWYLLQHGKGTRDDFEALVMKLEIQASMFDEG